MKKKKRLSPVVFRNEEEEEFCMGKHVLLYGFDDMRVILDEAGRPLASKSLAVIIEKAKQLGYDDPLCIYCTDRKFLFAKQAA